MTGRPLERTSRIRGIVLTCLLGCFHFGFMWPALANATPAESLLAKHAGLENRLRQNQFQRPVVLDSTETPNHVTGEIHAVIDYPFPAVSAGLNNPDHWCDVMHLHINTKYCRAVTTPAGTVLKVNIGKKTAEKLSDAPRVEFKYQAAAVATDYIDFRLSAKDGPMGTSDYRIELEAIPLEDGKTFLHLTYSYAMNFTARLAMQAYLATLGSGKVGFTQSGLTGAGQPQYIGGVRALVERNTMRYYLAIDSFLEAAPAAPALRLDRRLQTWFSAVEMYPRQLHEVERADYIAMKRDEYQRQQTAD